MSDVNDVEAFVTLVRERIKDLSSSDARVRRKAAEWLGESGEPSAISRLRQIYESDPNAKVRQAAEYSLGMFRALETALDGDEAEAVMETLEDIIVRNKTGRRNRISTQRLQQLITALIVSLLILVVFTFVVWPQLNL